MAISINWGSKVIYIQKSDTTLIQSSPQEIRELNLNTFRLALKDLEDSEAGMSFPDTHQHNTSVTVGGVTLSRVIEIINGYTITFEDGQYAVNLVGANSNVSDKVNVNQVSVRSSNSAGLITVVAGSGVTEEDKTDIISGVWNRQMSLVQSVSGSVGQALFDVRNNIEITLGLSQHNYRYIEQTYDSGNRLTSGKIRLYRNSTDANNNTNYFKEYEISANYESNGNLNNYKVIES